MTTTMEVVVTQLQQELLTQSSSYCTIWICRSSTGNQQSCHSTKFGKTLWVSSMWTALVVRRNSVARKRIFNSGRRRRRHSSHVGVGSWTDCGNLDRAHQSWIPADCDEPGARSTKPGVCVAGDAYDACDSHLRGERHCCQLAEEPIGGIAEAAGAIWSDNRRKEAKPPLCTNISPGWCSLLELQARIERWESYASRYEKKMKDKLHDEIKLAGLVDAVNSLSLIKGKWSPGPRDGCLSAVEHIFNETAMQARTQASNRLAMAIKASHGPRVSPNHRQRRE